MTTRTKLIMLACLTAATLSTSTAMAGQDSHDPVAIANSAFYGSLQDTRDESGNGAVLACQVYSGGAAPSIYCWAKDRYNNYKSCSSSDADLANVVSGVGIASKIFVYFSGGTCTRIYNQIGSHFLDRTPSDGTVITAL